MQKSVSRSAILSCYFAVVDAGMLAVALGYDIMKELTQRMILRNHIASLLGPRVRKCCSF